MKTSFMAWNAVFAAVNTALFCYAIFVLGRSEWHFATMFFNYVIYYAIQKGILDEHRSN